jgi:hypothetical protein
MPFTGKATYSAGPTLPELAEDVSDIISIVSPYETALLDHLGDPQRTATSTVHEWLEDALLPNTDTVDDGSILNPTEQATFGVANVDRFRVGDQIMLVGKEEIMLVTGIAGSSLTVTRQYGGSPTAELADGDTIRILGNAALEGDDAPTARFTNRSRKAELHADLHATVEVSGRNSRRGRSASTMSWTTRSRSGCASCCATSRTASSTACRRQSDPQGTGSTRRTMRGIRASLESNIFQPGQNGMPDGDGAGNDLLNETLLNAALREVWSQSSGSIDTIVCGGNQKRRINEFISTQQRFVDHDKTFSSMVEVYESDFGVCRVVLSRWVPMDTVLLLDSSRIDVLPLSGRSFFYKPLASKGDSEIGQLIGEYTMELRNENAHAAITGLGVAN